MAFFADLFSKSPSRYSFLIIWLCKYATVRYINMSRNPYYYDSDEIRDFIDWDPLELLDSMTHEKNKTKKQC